MSLKMGAMAVGVMSVMAIQAEECNDTDWDNLQDTDDNCMAQYNPAQLDTDADGRGDACDKETPDFGGELADCYITNYDELRGIGWNAVFYWPPGEYPESGYTPFNGRDFWLMAFGGEGSTLQTATYVEASATEVRQDGTIMAMSGTYEMLTCDEMGCTYPDDPEYWDAFNDGLFDAVAAFGDDCIPPP